MRRGELWIVQKMKSKSGPRKSIGKGSDTARIWKKSASKRGSEEKPNARYDKK
jgi:hypothetical protein